MTPEGKVKEQIKVLLAKHGAYWFMPVQNGMGAPSLDFIGCHGGWFFAVEAKAGRGEMTDRQIATTRRMGSAGAQVFLVNDAFGMKTLEDWLEVISALECKERRCKS